MALRRRGMLPVAAGAIVLAAASAFPARGQSGADPELAAVAERIRLEAPLRILVLGDSLSDQQRGSNYVDRAAFQIRKHNPGKFDFRNAGVGGDFITRVRQRLLGTVGGPPAHRQEMYETLFEPAPDFIFIFLGHNDTKVSSASGYTEPVVGPDDQDRAYREVVAFLRERCKARIVLVSSTSSVFEICERTARRNAEAGKAHNLFGRPENLEAFNAVLKSLAAELGFDYLDVYGPTRDHPDKAALFTADGVHLSPEGHRFIALRMLTYVAGRFPAGRQGRGARAAFQ